MNGENVTIGERLRSVRAEKGLTVSDVANKTGLSRGSISMLENDKNEPSAKALVQLSELYGVTTDWLLTGSGPMLSSFVDNTREDTPTHQLVDTRGNTVEQRGQLVDIPIEGIIAAGPPTEQNGDHDLLAPLHLALPNRSNYLALLVEGRSMEPAVTDRDVVLIRRTPDWLGIDGRICAVTIVGEVTLKRLFVDTSSKLIVLHPVNQDFRPIVVDPSATDIELVGVLAYLLRRYE